MARKKYQDYQQWFKRIPNIFTRGGNKNWEFFYLFIFFIESDKV